MARQRNGFLKGGCGGARLAILALCASAGAAAAQDYRHTFSGIAPGATLAQIEETFPQLGFDRVSAEPSGDIGDADTIVYERRRGIAQPDRIELVVRHTASGSQLALMRRTLVIADSGRASRVDLQASILKEHGQPSFHRLGKSAVSDLYVYRGETAEPGCSGYPFALTLPDRPLPASLEGDSAPSDCTSGMAIHVLHTGKPAERVRLATWLWWDHAEAGLDAPVAGEGDLSKWMAGGWTPIEEDCASSFGMTLAPDGSVSELERGGRWRVSGRRLTITYTHKVTDDGWGKLVPLVPPETHDIMIEPLSQDRALFKTPKGSGEFRRCGDAGG